MTKDPDAKFEKGMNPKQKSAFKKQDDKNDAKLSKSVKASSPPLYKPSLHVEGREAKAIHKGNPVGTKIKMMVHAKVTNHGISTFNGNQPTAALEVQRMVPMKAPKAPPMRKMK